MTTDTQTVGEAQNAPEPDSMPEFGRPLCITRTEHAFDLITVPDSKNGEATVPFEYTACEHLVIVPMAVDGDQRRGAFGAWRIYHISTGRTLPIPTPHDQDVDRVRWFANELAKLDVDWTADRATLMKTVGIPMQALIKQADEDDANSTPPGYIPASVMRAICEQNSRANANLEINRG
jgi:hypothetical protein